MASVIEALKKYKLFQAPIQIVYKIFVMCWINFIAGALALTGTRRVECYELCEHKVKCGSQPLWMNTLSLSDVIIGFKIFILRTELCI